MSLSNILESKFKKNCLSLKWNNLDKIAESNREELLCTASQFIKHSTFSIMYNQIPHSSTFAKHDL